MRRRQNLLVWLLCPIDGRRGWQVGRRRRPGACGSGILCDRFGNSFVGRRFAILLRFNRVSIVGDARK